MDLRACTQCGQFFTSGKGGGRYCSKDCHHVVRTATRLLKEPPKKKREPNICGQCGKLYRPINKKRVRKYCSLLCGGIARRGTHIKCESHGDDTRPGVIYALLEPDTNEVRYIGQTNDIGRRTAKYRCGYGNSPYLTNWLKKLKREGRQFGVRILETCERGLATAERKWIAYGWEQGWRLMNATAGGEGGIIDPARLLAMSERGKAWIAVPANRRRLRLTQQRRGAEKVGQTLQQWRQAKAATLSANRPEGKAKRQAIRQAERDAKRKAAELEKKQLSTLIPLSHKGTAFVPLTRGKWAMVDLADWEKVSRHRWNAGKDVYLSGKVRWRAKRNYEGGKCEMLSWRIAEATSEQRVRHLNRNQLDCRRSNLQVY